ncbi:MAG: hypothetical protein AAFV95_05975 [Bacteroidota bacterium]
MKHILIFGLVLLLGATDSWGQDSLEARIQKARRDYFQRELQLTEAEAEKFWPLYDQMRDEQDELQKKYKMNRKIELMSDTEVEKFVLSTFELEEKQLELKKRYFVEFKKIMSVRKVASMRRTEQRFKRELLKRMRNRSQGNRKRQNRDLEDDF